MILFPNPARLQKKMGLHVNGKNLEVNKKIFKLLMDSDASGLFDYFTSHKYEGKYDYLIFLFQGSENTVFV